MNEWPEPDYDKEWDGEDGTVPCPLCGAEAAQPCKEGCPQLVATPWELHAQAWETKPW